MTERGDRGREQGRRKEDDPEVLGSQCQAGRKRFPGKDHRPAPPMLCPATHPGMGEGERDGQTGLASCLTTSLLPRPAATVGFRQPATLSTGNNGELLGAVSPAVSQKGRNSNVSLSWVSEPTASPMKAMGESLAAGGRAHLLGAPPPPSASSRPLSPGVPLHLNAIYSS